MSGVEWTLVILAIALASFVASLGVSIVIEAWRDGGGQ